MGRRTLLLLTSLLIAAVGTALVAIYVRGADQRALDDVSSIEVLVAKTQIPAGTPVDQVLPNSTIQPVFEREVVKGFTVRNVAELGRLKNQELKAPVYEGQVIDTRMFQPAGDRAAAATAGITKGNVMMSVQMADPNRVAAYIEQGSQIAVFLSWDAEPGKRETEVLVPSARVVAVGSPVVTDTAASTPRTGAGANDESVPTTIVTLDVKQDAAQRLFHAQSAGPMYFALTNKDSVINPKTIINDQNLIVP